MNVKQSSLLLESLLELQRKAVGIKFLFTAQDYANCNAGKPAHMMAYCTMVKKASEGEACKARLDDLACLGGAMALGLLKPDHDTISGKRRSTNGAYKDLCVSRSISREMVYCVHEVYGVEIRPLAAYDEAPDVVLIITDPYNAMRIIQGNAYYNGFAKSIKMVGMQAICQECTSYPYETNSINISMMCAGTRMLSQWGRNELGIGMPFQKFLSVLDGIKQTVNPLERNKQKKVIESNFKANQLDPAFVIEYDKNYDTGAYVGIKGLQKKATEESRT